MNSEMGGMPTALGGHAFLAPIDMPTQSRGHATHLDILWRKEDMGLFLCRVADSAASLLR
jgi:hypothetical protein